MAALLLDEDLLRSEEGDEVRALARARTLTVLGRVDHSRKGSVVQFLYESRLIQKGQPVVALDSALLDDMGCAARTNCTNLSSADLSGTNMDRARLRGINLSDADLTATRLFQVDLRRAILKGADLSEANLTCADLSSADLGKAMLTGTNLSRAKLNDVANSDVDL
jgi:uncharacterized protein YjbI with pentapeptide repeats